MAPTTRSTGRTRRCIPRAASGSSPLHTRLDAAGAVFGSKFGWERPNWFAAAGAERVDRPSFEAKPNWFDAVAEEHRAIRERVAVIDQTSFAKFEMSGPGAAAFLQRIADNDVDRAGRERCIYTQLCNETGGIEADLTLMRLAPRPLLRRHRLGLRRARHGLDRDSTCRDGRTAPRGDLGLCGDQCRAGRDRATCSQPLTDDDLSNAAFPYLSVARDRARPCAGARRARRLCRRARLGAACAGRVCRPTSTTRIMEAGRPHGIANAGYRAIDSLPDGEGLSLLVERHHAGHQSLRGRPRLLRARSTRATSSAARRWRR